MATVMTDIIGRDLNMDDQVVWITSACLLTSGAFVLPFGTLADTIGRKNKSAIAIICTTLAVSAAGWAPDGPSLIVFTALIGLFSAAAVSPAVGQLGAVYSETSKRRNRAFACFSAGNPLGFVIGSFIAGIVLEVTRGWRACFWVFSVFVAGFAGLVAFTVPSDAKIGVGVGRGDSDSGGSGATGGSGRVSGWEVLKRFDLLGALFVTGGVSSVSAGLTLAGVAPKGWATPYVIVLIVLGVVFLGVFILWQSVYKFPLMPLYIWRNRNFSLVIILLSTGTAAFSCHSFWLCLYLQREQRLSALWVAIYLLPQNINAILVNIICSLIMHRVSHRVLMGIGAVSYLASFLLLALLQPIRLYYWAFIFPSLLFAVVGADMQFNVANSYVMSSLPREQQSLAGGILSAVNKLLSNIALSVSTAVYYAGQQAGQVDENGLPGYRAAFWMLVAVAGVNILLVPLLRIEKKVMEDTAPLTESETDTEKTDV